MKGLLKSKLVLSFAAFIMIAAAIAIPLVSGSVTRSHAAPSPAHAAAPSTNSSGLELEGVCEKLDSKACQKTLAQIGQTICQSAGIPSREPCELNSSEITRLLIKEEACKEDAHHIHQLCEFIHFTRRVFTIDIDASPSGSTAVDAAVTLSGICELLHSTGCIKVLDKIADILCTIAGEAPCPISGSDLANFLEVVAQHLTCEGISKGLEQFPTIEGVAKKISLFCVLIEIYADAIKLKEHLLEQPVFIANITGEFFKNPNNSGAFDVSPSTTPEFTQPFPIIFFNPPPADQNICPAPTGVDESTRPFTDVNINANCALIIAGGNGEQAGVGTLYAFEAVFTADLIVPRAGNVDFSILSDDGWILSLGPGNGNQPTYISGPLNNAPATGPFKGYPVVGANNQATSAVLLTVTINVPAAGTYPIELDYTECCGYGLNLDFGASYHLTSPAQTAYSPSA